MARRDTNTEQQTLSITAPGAMSLMLADDFTQWQEMAIPMQKAAGDGRQESDLHPETTTIASLWTAVVRRLGAHIPRGQSLRHSRCREASRLTLNDRLPGSVP